ncbi:hypothetical protein ANCCEY_12877 [Ancylostoma ceylanicum]|uniref:Rieske domain-containing protein n=1 Tax=Ancylostoma ceylanicum TaxID=53326 RepID=A0A0D6L8R3_9BILA|nr:hypothetical protein ANCCEY_12877 [Ancylostoma ceylanicum]
MGGTIEASCNGNGKPHPSIYSNGKIRCPLHGACFNVKTGDIEDYPGFDCLFTYDVQDVNGDLVLNTTEKELASARRTRKSNLKATCNDAPIIVVGAVFADEQRNNNSMLEKEAVLLDEERSSA